MSDDWQKILQPAPKGWLVKSSVCEDMLHFILIAPGGKKYETGAAHITWYAMHPKLSQWRNQVWQDVLQRHNFMTDGTLIVDAGE